MIELDLIVILDLSLESFENRQEVKFNFKYRQFPLDYQFILFYFKDSENICIVEQWNDQQRFDKSL